ncbi:MAG: N-acetylglucosamine-6-phosphate deacetylase [Planctomyces sp.]|nr:N-acetylglucosamine-6-phosphate deacetylase [Planctomyces sp.]
MPSRSVLARRYDSGDPVRATIADGRLAEIVPLWTREPLDDWPWIAPGFFDLQLNGYGGIWFSDERLTVEQVLEVLARYPRHGVTRLCPTLITNSQAALRHGLATIRAACEREPWADAMVAGCHLEGPHISLEDGPRGAHPLAHVRPCSLSEFEELNAASGNRVRLATLAPECPGAPDFIRGLVERRVAVAIGHTAATPEQIAAAVDAGAAFSTHLGNAAHRVLPRHPNYLWDQLGEPRLAASVISDSHHLPASVLRSIVAAKTPERIIITCDASGLAGCEPGVHETPLGTFEMLDDGRIVIAGQRTLLAGSGLMTDACVAFMLQATGVRLREACDMAGRVPATMLGLPAGRLLPGEPANLALFRWSRASRRIDVLETFCPAGPPG